jgi:hypothetical protein
MATTITAAGVNFPQYASSARPTGALGLVIYNSDSKLLEQYDGSQWIPLSSKNAPYLYRQVIASGYVAGGYKDSTPWRNVNKMNHATDVMGNLGDLLQSTAAYTSGFCNRDNAFLWGASGMGSGSYTISFNMRSDTTLSASTNHNTTRAVGDTGTAFKEHELGFICGGGSATMDIFNGSTETMQSASHGKALYGDGDTDSAHSTVSDEFKSLGGCSTGGFKLGHNTATVSSVTVGFIGGAASPGPAFTSNGQQKGINSKTGKGWVSNEGTYQSGYNYRRWQFSTETNLGTVVRPIGNMGEENYDMGQDHQYMHGAYGNSVQHNRSQKWYYWTETGVELGTASQRIGVPGGSSGHGFWRD